MRTLLLFVLGLSSVAEQRATVDGRENADVPDLRRVGQRAAIEIAAGRSAATRLKDPRHRGGASGTFSLLRSQGAQSIAGVAQCAMLPINTHTHIKMDSLFQCSIALSQCAMLH